MGGYGLLFYSTLDYSIPNTSLALDRRVSYKKHFLEQHASSIEQRHEVEGFQKEFRMKDAVYVVANTLNTVIKDSCAYLARSLACDYVQ